MSQPAAPLMEPRLSAAEDDAVLIRAVQRGDRAAFQQLVVRYDESVLRLARGIVRSEEDAWEVYQETFIKAFRSIARFRFECSFYTWIYRIATNACLDYLRRQATRREVSSISTDAQGEPQDAFDDLSDQAPVANPERLLLGREVGHRIERAMRRLTARERMVFELKHYEGLRLRTIGEILQMSEETAKNTLFRGTQKLRAALADLVGRTRAARRSTDLGQAEAGE